MNSASVTRTFDVCFMPQVLPDELFYSFIGRMCSMNALGNTRERMQLLFGSKSLFPVVDLPTRLNHFQSALGETSPWNSSLEIIDQATIYPYHRPFLTETRNISIEKILLGGAGKSLKTLLGRVANRFGAAPALRFCPECLVGDTRRYGVPYWHRTHQLPGVTACVTHKSNLLMSLEDHQRIDRQRVILPPNSYNVEFATTAPHPLQLAFAALSNELLTVGLRPLEGTDYKKLCRNAIFALGLVNKGYINYRELASAVRTHYDDFVAFYHRDRLLSSQRNPLCWLRALIERPTRSSHPICHLLLIGFLFKSIEELCRQLSYPPQQIDSPTNACPQASHPRVQINPNENLLRDTRLSCREIARLVNCSVTTIVYKRRALGIAISGRPKNRLFNNKAKILIMLHKGVAPRKIAIDCNVSLSMVYRIRAEIPKAGLDSKVRNFEIEREKRRQCWKEILVKSAEMGPTAGRKLSPGTYAWLYRHDRAWLHDLSVGFQTHRAPCTRINWCQRDTELCALVRILVAKVRAQISRPRISRTLMMRHIGDASVRANLARLPKLKSLIDELEETKLSYQCERIYLATLTLLEAGQPIVEWRIQRTAGIRIWTAAHSDFVNSILNEHRSQNNL